VRNWQNACHSRRALTAQPLIRSSNGAQTCYTSHAPHPARWHSNIHHILIGCRFLSHTLPVLLFLLSSRLFRILPGCPNGWLRRHPRHHTPAHHTPTHAALPRVDATCLEYNTLLVTVLFLMFSARFCSPLLNSAVLCSILLSSTQLTKYSAQPCSASRYRYLNPVWDLALSPPQFTTTLHDIISHPRSRRITLYTDACILYILYILTCTAFDAALVRATC